VVPLQVVEHLRESLYRGQMKALESEKGENFDPNHEKVDMMIGIPAARVRCTTEPVTSDELVRIAVKVQDLECSTGGNWVIAASLSRPEIRWIGRADDEERIGRSQEVAMVFSMDQAYWFDGPTGRTLFAPTP
jgi:hypothetical protein